MKGFTYSKRTRNNGKVAHPTNCGVYSEVLALANPAASCAAKTGRILRGNRAAKNAFDRVTRSGKGVRP